MRRKWVLSLIIVYSLFTVKQIWALECRSLFWTPDNVVLKEIEIRVPGPDRVFKDRVETGSSIKVYGSENIYAPKEWVNQQFGYNVLKEALSLDFSQIQRVLIIGSGTGYESIILAKKFPHLKIDASDIDPEAVFITQRNAELHGVSKQINPVLGDLFEGVNGTYDLIMFVAPRPMFKKDIFRDFLTQYPVSQNPKDQYRIESSARRFTEKVYNEVVLKNPHFFDAEGKLYSRYLTEFPNYLNSGGLFILMTEENLRAPIPKDIEHHLVYKNKWHPNDPLNYGIHIFRKKTSP